jgi:hypothetical protein
VSLEYYLRTLFIKKIKYFHFNALISYFFFKIYYLRLLKSIVKLFVNIIFLVFFVKREQIEAMIKRKIN